MNKVNKSANLRVDLSGGTLDLWPICSILLDAKTINLALSLKAEVDFELLSGAKGHNQLKIVSKDYNKNFIVKFSDIDNKSHLKRPNEWTFLLELTGFFLGKIADNDLHVTLSSGSPPGAGLGGSSTMGIAYFKGLCELFQIKMDHKQTISIVRDIEARILNSGPSGYQDYYPACEGGILGLSCHYGDVLSEQLFSKKLKEFLEKHLKLVYSNISRNSGINNWMVYKNFFDKDLKTIDCLRKIAANSIYLDSAIKKMDGPKILQCIVEDGDLRKEMYEDIVPKEVMSFQNDLQGLPLLGVKMCGAGGGGCFLTVFSDTLTKNQNEIFQKSLLKNGMKELDFLIDGPLE